MNQHLPGLRSGPGARHPAHTPFELDDEDDNLLAFNDEEGGLIDGLEEAHAFDPSFTEESSPKQASNYLSNPQIPDDLSRIEVTVSEVEPI